jgi:hypothetical protein
MVERIKDKRMKSKEMSNENAFAVCVYCNNLYNCKQRSLSPFMLFLCVRNPPDDG